MKRTIVLLSFVGIALISGQIASSQSSSEIDGTNVEAWHAANQICRGVGFPEIYEPACELRDQLGKRLEANGFCGDGSRWILCEPESSLASDTTDDAELSAYLSTAKGLETVCRYGKTGDQGSSDAQSLCVGRLSGVASLMQYNCISIQAGAQPLPLLVMGDYPDGVALVETFIRFMEENPQEGATEWSFVALTALSGAYPCR